jgi:hypothetical protein
MLRKGDDRGMCQIIRRGIAEMQVAAPGSHGALLEREPRIVPVKSLPPFIWTVRPAPYSLRWTWLT